MLHFFPLVSQPFDGGSLFIYRRNRETATSRSLRTMDSRCSPQEFTAWTWFLYSRRCPGWWNRSVLWLITIVPRGSREYGKSRLDYFTVCRSLFHRVETFAFNAGTFLLPFFPGNRGNVLVRSGALSDQLDLLKLD